MSSKRTRALWDSASPAITPIIPPASEVSRLLGLLYAERNRHQRLERALSKYQAILEQQLTAQREAFALLGKELLPAQRRGKQ
jgi:hypothetical protein